MAGGADRSRTVLAGVIVALILLSGAVAYAQFNEPPARAATTQSTDATPTAPNNPTPGLAAISSQLTTATSVRTATVADISLSSFGPSLAGSWTVNGSTDVQRSSGLYRVAATGFDESDLELIGLADTGVTPTQLTTGVDIVTLNERAYLRTDGGVWQPVSEVDGQFIDNLGNLNAYAALINACQPTAVLAQADGGTKTQCRLVVTPAVTLALGLSPDAAQQLASRANSTTITMDVRTDADGILRSLRVNASVATFGLTADLRTAVNFSEWNQPVTLPAGVG